MQRMAEIQRQMAEAQHELSKLKGECTQIKAMKADVTVVLEDLNHSRDVLERDHAAEMRRFEEMRQSR